jgi:ribose transport system ATP-binding protein
MLELRSVGKRFGGIVALQEVSLTVHTAEIHALMGENGAGKSTLIKILTGEHTAYDGQILIDGTVVHPRGSRDVQDRLGIACIHQELSLVPELSIAENLFLAREPRTRWRTLDTTKMLTDSRALLDRVGCDLDPRRRVHGLRTGEQQLIEIARALSLNARLILFDEPTSALSDRERERLMTVIERLKTDSVTVVYISHKLDEVFRLADRITVLRDGRRIATSPKSAVDAPALLEQMAGRAVALFTDRPRPHPGAEVLAVEGLTLRAHGDARPLSDLSLSLRRGEVLGVAGLMGAGRTELLESLFGAMPAGQVRARRFRIDGVERPLLPTPSAALRAGLALVTEDRKQKSLILPLSVRHNLTLAALKTFLRGGWLRAAAETQAVSAQLAALQVKTRGAETAVSALSGGNQQKVVLGRCLLTAPKVLLLDEPTRGIDVGAKSEIYRLIETLAADGMAVLVASSEIPELLALCDRIAVLAEGRLTAILSRDEATPERILAAATARPAAPVEAA